MIGAAESRAEMNGLWKGDWFDEAAAGGMVHGSLQKRLGLRIEECNAV